MQAKSDSFSILDNLLKYHRSRVANKIFLSNRFDPLNANFEAVEIHIDVNVEPIQ